MKNTILTIFIKCLFFLSQCLYGQTEYTDILFTQKKIYFVDENQVYEIINDNVPQKIFSFEGIINHALIKENELWIASDKGLFIYNKNNFKIISTLFSGKKIVSISIDNNGLAWVASQYDGVFCQLNKNSFDFELKLNNGYNYVVVSTPDNILNVGTNLGLYRLNLKNNDLKRYAEEAHSGHGLPDNIVENIFADEYSNLWIIMPDNLAFLKNDNLGGEMPIFSHIGQKNNIVKNILEVDRSYLFHTNQGLLFLPEMIMKHHSHNHEVFNQQDSEALLLSAKDIKTPEKYCNDKILAISKFKNEIYFLTKNGSWKITQNKLLKVLRNKKIAAKVLK